MSMGPDLGLKDKPKTAMKSVLSSKKHKTLAGNAENKCADSAHDFGTRNFVMENLSDGKSSFKEVNIPDNNRDMDVDILESRTLGDHALGDAECEDATDNSSSFGDTVSETENDSLLSDAEVQSQLCGLMGSGFDGFAEPLQIRKKKLTDHWRRFIHPLKWRCKWLELRLKELKCQELKYHRQLAEYNEQKQFEFEKKVLEGGTSKSQPFPCQVHRKKVMKRMKRKQVEKAVDMASYMSKHNLFSYYESRKSNSGGASMTGDYGKLDDRTFNGNDVIELSLEFRDNCSDQILQNIEMLQSQVNVLKARIDKVLSENPMKFAPVNRNFLVPCDTPAGSQVHPSDHGNKFNGNDVFELSLEFKDSCSDQILQNIEMLQSQVNILKARIDKVLSENPMEFSPFNRNFLVPSDMPAGSQVHRSENGVKSLYTSSQHVTAVSSHVEVTHLPDFIQSLYHQIGGSCETADEEILIDNKAAREGLREFQGISCQQAEKPHRQTEIEIANAVQPVMPPVCGLLATKILKLSVQLHPELPSATKAKDHNKKKKKKRKRR